MSRKDLISIGMVTAIGVLVLVGLSLSEKKASGNIHGGHDHSSHGHGAGGHDDHDHGEARGPHGGKILEEGEFELELVFYEKGDTPHLRAYPSYNHKPLDPKEVKVSVELERLGGKVETFKFQPTGEFLFSSKEIPEPHSFFVKVEAEWKEKKFDWEYSQYEGRMTVSDELAGKMGLETESAGPGDIRSILTLPGEVTLNDDTVAHVVPRVPGIILSVRKNLGDEVKKGEVLAVVDSRELGDARSAYLVAIEREKLARFNHDRTQRLWEASTVAEREFLTMQQAYMEQRIERVAAERKLKAWGMTKEEIAVLAEGNDDDLTHYVIRAPFDGVVVKKHISLGEWVKEDAEIYVISDLSTVWVDITVYANDLKSVYLNQQVKVKTESNGLEAVGKVSYIEPLVGEDSRTAKARVVLPNPDGRLRPGLFATVELVRSSLSSPVVIRSDAVQTYDNKPVVFFHHEDQYEIRPVTLGGDDGKFAEVVKGLSAGERYVTKNSYVLKAELGKSGMSHEH